MRVSSFIINLYFWRNKIYIFKNLCIFSGDFLSLKFVCHVDRTVVGTIYIDFRFPEKFFFENYIKRFLKTDVLKYKYYSQIFDKQRNSIYNK